MKIISISSKNRYMVIEFSLTNICNYKCSYCYQLKDKKNSLDIEDCLNFFKKIRKIYPDENIKILLMGGETLYYKDIDILLDTLYNMNIKVDITTNGSKPKEWWKKYAPKIENICVSYHPTEVSEEAFIQQCKNIVKYSKRHLSIMLMLPYETFFENIKFAERLSEEVPNLIILGKLLHNRTHYTEKCLLFYKSNNRWKSKKFKSNKSIFDDNFLEVRYGSEKNIITTKDLIKNNQNNFKGYKCFLGIYRFFVNFDGNVYGASCGEGHLGSIKKFTISKKAILCPRDVCNCPEDIKIRKEIDEP